MLQDSRRSAHNAASSWQLLKPTGLMRRLEAISAARHGRAPSVRDRDLCCILVSGDFSAVQLRFFGMRFGWPFIWLIIGACLGHADDPVFRSETSLALIHFHVVKSGKNATAIVPEDLTLLEDGVPRKFTVFENAATHRSLPVEVTLLFDFSDSVRNAELYDPLAFKEGLLDHLDDVSLALYGFDNKLYRYSSLTRDPKVLSDAFTALARRNGPRQEIPIVLPGNHKQTTGGTWIYASVLQASREMTVSRQNATRLMLVYSDGLDTTTLDADRIVDLLRERQVAVYPVALGHRALAGWHGTGNEKLEYRVLEFASLGELTGGRSYDPETVNRTVMTQILSSLVREAHTEYVIGFSPEPSGKPAKHKLEVRVNDKHLGEIVGGTRTIIH